MEFNADELYKAYFPDDMREYGYSDGGEEREELFSLLDCLIFVLEAVRKEGALFAESLGIKSLKTEGYDKDEEAFMPISGGDRLLSDRYAEEISKLFEMIYSYIDERRENTVDRKRLPFFYAVKRAGLDLCGELSVLCAFAARYEKKYEEYFFRKECGAARTGCVGRSMISSFLGLFGKAEPGLRTDGLLGLFFMGLNGEDIRLNDAAFHFISQGRYRSEYFSMEEGFDEELLEELYEAETEKLCRMIGDFSDRSLAVVISGDLGSGRRTAAKRAVLKTEKKAVLFDLKRAAGEPFASDIINEAVFTAFINEAGLIISGFSGDVNETRSFYELTKRIKLLKRPVFFISDTKEREIEELPAVRINIPWPSERERALLWDFFLKRLPFEKEERKRLSESYANRYYMNAEAVKRTSEDAVFYLPLSKTPKEALVRSCYHRRSHSLGKTAELIRTDFTMSDLVLEEDTRKQLEYIMAQVKYRGIVGEKWGFYDKTPYGRGVSALFYGPPGTGKTMAVQALGNELGLDVFRIDISRMISKYIGETEKNISELFDGASKLNAILFFDEADALFAKRSEVQDANDRNANAETAHLLQKFEGYGGVVILATNLRENIDDAFKRRMKFAVCFKLPGAEERRLLWRKTFPESSPREDISYDFFADSFELSGSAIKEIAVNAAYMAAAEGTIRDRHIVEALKLHYAKFGKTLGDEDFRFLG